MDHIASLFSGSTGNSTYIGDENSGILIDAGKSCRAIFGELSNLGFGGARIEGIFITHTHSDHISALVNTLRRFPSIPVYGSEETLQRICGLPELPADAVFRPVSFAGTEVNRFFVRAFSTPHDCEGSCGYTVCVGGGQKVGVCTDLGEVTDTVASALRGCRTVFIESNHDENVLLAGPYPYPLKRRILSSVGHLSNDMCGSLAAFLLQGGTKNFVLGHLSQENNMPDIAFETVHYHLCAAGAQESADYCLQVAAPYLSARHYAVG